MGTLSITLQMILCLSILVVLHECGHFFPAKWFKTRVEKFYLFFNPWFSLFKIKKGETEYGIGWVPFGGYVKIAGMIDESMDTEQMKGEPQPWEFRSKPAWQRLIIMIGGVVVNFILGFFIFAMILFFYGKTYFKTDDLKYGIAVEELGKQLGLQDGDIVLGVGETELYKFDPVTVTKEIVLKDAEKLTIKRDNEIIDLSVPADFAKQLTSGGMKSGSLFSVRFPMEVSRVSKNSIAEEHGLEPGDRIIKINGKNVEYSHIFFNEIRQHGGKSIDVLISRSGETLSKTIAMDSSSLLGIALESPNAFLNVSRDKYGFFESLPMGVKEGVGFLGDQLDAFGQMFRKKISAKDNLGSVFSIAKMFDPSWNWEVFWKITAMLSIILAFFNILPIPALDGGYVLFLLWEVVTGRKPNDKFMEVVTFAGFIILILLMIYVLGLDILRLF
jgi:regulator of sigma E protease